MFSTQSWETGLLLLWLQCVPTAVPQASSPPLPNAYRPVSSSLGIHRRLAAGPLRRPPQETKIRGRSSPLYKTAQHLHITYTHLPTYLISKFLITPYTMSMLRKQLLACSKLKVCFFELSGIFFLQIFSTCGWVNPRM